MKSRKYIGSYAAAMGGVDAIVFTAGVGENSAEMRAAHHATALRTSWAPKLDPEANRIRGQETVDQHAPDSKVKVLVIPTNEELMIAQDTAALCQ